MFFKIRPGIFVGMLGFGGLIFTFADGSGEIGSKIPIALFFLVIMMVGIGLEMMPKEMADDTFGEMPERIG